MFRMYFAVACYTTGKVFPVNTKFLDIISEYFSAILFLQNFKEFSKQESFRYFSLYIDSYL